MMKMLQPCISLIQPDHLPSLRWAILAMLGTLNCGTLTTHGGWKLFWSDEFNGSSIDTNYWKFESGNDRGWGRHELEYYTGRPENAYVSNGLLHIVARKEATNGFAYTPARLK